MLKLLFLSLALMAEPRVDILDRATLETLDRPGKFSFATLMGSDRRALDKMHQKSVAYASVADLIKADIEEIVKTTGEKMAYSTELAEEMAKDGKVPRFLDPYWLTSKMASFPLIAVVNRIDKKDIYPGTCGEVRFIYRLAYVSGDTRSTLPLFMNVVYDYPAGDCASLARRWEASDLNGMFADIQFKQLEINGQVVRYPSELKYDFGGQAVYLFRIVKPTTDGKFAPIPLENTLNVAAILGSKELKNALYAQIEANIAKIDDGTFVFENTGGQLLADRAISFTTVGRARLANKPFSQVFGADGQDLAGVDLIEAKFVKSARGLVERLNNSTCMGCHQTGGTAGFHMLGATSGLNSAFNQLQVPFSPHYGAERVRRARELTKLVAGQAPTTFRPPSFFPAAKSDGSFGPAKSREACLAKDQADYSVGLRCGEGTACYLTAKNTAGGLNIGECVNVPNKVAGSVCRRGTVTSAPVRPELGDLYALFGITDTIDANNTFNEDGGCTVPEQGVPLGRISRRCQSATDDGKMKFVDSITKASEKPKEMCVIQGGDVFDNCAKSSNPTKCLDDAAATIARAFLDTCTSTHFCREDYICQQLPHEISKQYSGTTKATVKARVEKLQSLGVGFCVPNYFVFNMRADGHILPEGRVEAER